MPNNILCIKSTKHVDGSETSCYFIMNISQRSGKSSSATLRCTKNRNHETSVRRNTFFANSNLTNQDIMNFVKCDLGGVDGNLHFPVPSMNRLNQTEPATFSILPCWASFSDSVLIYFRSKFFTSVFKNHRNML
jgi:hypothetical protein